jgi:tetratricopeptide (TPR) repeat protein
MGPKVVITISEAGTAAIRTHTYSIIVDGQKIEDREFSPVESQEIKEIYGQYSSLFEKGCQGQVSKDYLDLLGKGIFHLFLENVWGNLKPRIEQSAEVLVVSEIPEVLGLPWELLSFPGGIVLGFNSRFDIKRIANADEQIVGTGALPAGPLRILFMVCDPFDYDSEEKSLFKALEGREVLWEVCDTGTFEELKKRAEAFRPHLVHLVGQGRLRKSLAYFSFEGASGKPDLRDASDIGSVLAATGVQCLVLGGCQTEMQRSLELVCQGLRGKIPIAISWNASADSTVSFYRSLATGQEIERAVFAARQEIKNKYDDKGRICALPIVYFFIYQSQIFDSKKRSHHFMRIDEQKPLMGLTEGYAEEFVDRRKDLQRLFVALREGAARALVITGKDGVGKSTLATRLALNLIPEGYTPIHVYSSNQNPLSAIRVLEGCISIFVNLGLIEIVKDLKDGSNPLSERLEKLLGILNKGKFLLLLDGPELDEKTGEIKDQELAGFYIQMLRQVDNGRAIVTSRTLPADVMTLPSRVWEWSLANLSEAALIKFILRDETAAELYRTEAINYEQLQKLYLSSAGSPSCLVQMRKALSKGMARLGGCEDSFSLLYDTLSSEKRQALSQAAIYGIAVNMSGIAEVSGQPEDKIGLWIQEWKRLSFAFQPIGHLLAVPSSVRPWLLGQLGPEQLRKAHEAAGNYLRNLAEQGRANELGLSRLDCLLECRCHYLSMMDLEKAREVTASISGYMERRGYYREIMKINRELLEIEVHTGPMNWIARAYMDEGNYSQAQEWYKMVLDIKPEAVACHGLGTALFHQGKHEDARDSFNKTLEICRGMQDLAGEAAALHALASINMELKLNDAALEKMQNVAEIQKKLGDLSGLAATLSQMASIDLDRGNYGEARKDLIEALEITKLTGDIAGQASVLRNMASIDLEKGDLDKAYDEFRRSLELKRELGDRKSQAVILHHLGSIEARKGEIAVSTKSFREALELYWSLGESLGEAGALFQLGALAVQESHIPEGLRLMALSAMILRRKGSEDVKNVEPVVERLASQLNYSQEQFLGMVREVSQAYRKDKGRSLVEMAFRS